jgi:hypothetical protein
MLPEGLAGIVPDRPAQKFKPAVDPAGPHSSLWQTQRSQPRSRNVEETPMKVMVIVKATNNSEAGAQPSEQLMTEMFKYNEELVKAGIMLAGDGLYPSSKGKRIQFSGSRRTVVDGPFTETKELIAGYWIWQVRSMEEAVEWARRCPNPMPGEDSELEIRPIIEAQDYGEVFGEALTPDLRAQNERLQAEIERKTKS